MSFEQDAELIDSYNNWVLERKRQASDLTAEAFLADRMKADAAERVLTVIETIDGFGQWNDVTQRYEHVRDDLGQAWIRNIEKILRGDL